MPSKALSQLRQASFRGVAFQVASVEDSNGRRTVTHAYPNFDGTYTEDLGKSPDGFQVDGFVVGADYIDQAARLKKACQQAGSGLLAHPWLGSMTVICLDCRTLWSPSHLRECRLRMTFQEEGKRQYPDDSNDYAALAEDTVASALETFTLKFRETYTTSGPGWISTEMAKVASQAFSLLGQVAKVAGIGSAGLGELLGQVQAAINTAGSLAGNAASLAGTVTTLGGKLTTVLEAKGPAAALESTLALADYSANLSGVNIPTAAARTLVSSAAGFAALVDRVAVSSGVKLALSADYGSRNEALAAKSRIISKLDDLKDVASQSADHESFEALRELQVLVVEAMDQKAGGLPGLASVKISPTATPALVLAYDLYQDLGREAEILSRNPQVVHPGLLPGGDYLEVADA